MRLYAGTSTQFIEDSTQNQIAEKLKSAFFHYFRYDAPPSEVNAWRNSLRAFAQVLTSSNLLDHGIILEYQIPLTSLRLDVIVSGHDNDSIPNAVIVELKQWEKAEPSSCENEVVTFVGGRLREVLHPSVQADRYRTFLADAHTAFYGGTNAVQLFACSYLHNYTFNPEDAIFAPKFDDALMTVPLFCADHVPRMRTFLKAKLDGGRGAEVLNRIEESNYRPSRKLMEHVAKVIKDQSDYVLLDEQLVVYDKVLALADDKFHNRKKSSIIVKGGPGTGKSVIALNLLADLLRRGFNAQYATGSKAFNETLSKIIGSRGSQQFKSTHQYGKVDRDTVDVLIVDEAHRIREHTMIPFQPRSKVTQIEEMLNAARVTVFFIDDIQVVRPNEIGSTWYIRDMAEKAGHEVFEHQLDIQFRCAGCEGFVNWIDNTLGIRRTANVIWDASDKFDFKIFASPAELDQAIRIKADSGFTARMTAGFCWNWSDPLPDGTLETDVAIGDYRRAWNAKPNAGKLATGIPKAALWASMPGGLDQIGCIYTAQGFEFDYVGVIVGTDLTYDFDIRNWRGQPENSCDSVVKKAKGQFTDLVKNTYRVLLTRGMKGCYVCFLDKFTEQFIRTRTE